MIKLMKPNQVQQNYYINTKCHAPGHHGQISTPYFWQTKQEKLLVNYHDGNDLLNAPKIITMIPYKYRKRNSLNKYLAYRYHVTESYLDIMAQTFLVDSMYLYFILKFLFKLKNLFKLINLFILNNIFILNKNFSSINSCIYS